MNLWANEATTLDEEGKTKKVFTFLEQPSLVRMASKDDITAGDGKRHEILPGKGALSTTTTVNVFRLLRRRGIPVAFIEQDSETSFIAENCTMIDLEVVGRWKVGPKSSLLKRNPNIQVGVLLEHPLVEFFLKTSGKVWKGRSLPCDDPYLELENKGKGVFGVYEPNKPITAKNKLLELPLEELDLNVEDIKRIAEMQWQVAVALKGAFQQLGCDLQDFKAEYGFPLTKERLLLADVLDNDSWRLYWEGRDISKQPFRDGAPLFEVLRDYQTVAEFTKHFML